jgi:hypothetical protein
VSRFIVQVQPTDQAVSEAVGPVEAVLSAGPSSRRVSAEENHRRIGSTGFAAALELDDGVENSLARRGAGGRASIHCGHVSRRVGRAAATVRTSGLASLRPVNGRS